VLTSLQVGELLLVVVASPCLGGEPFLVGRASYLVERAPCLVAFLVTQASYLVVELVVQIDRIAVIDSSFLIKSRKY